jgi:hypothetical protein
MKEARDHKSLIFRHYAPIEVREPSLPSPSSPSNLPSTPPSTLVILAKVWSYCSVVFFTFLQTISVFPAVTVLVESALPTKTVWTERYFTLVTCFLLFNIGDYVGRAVASRLRWPRANRAGKIILLSATALRFAFIPLLMFCNAAPGKRRTDVLIHSDTVYIALMVVFSLSNGYLCNMGMIHGPKAFETRELQGSRKEPLSQTEFFSDRLLLRSIIFLRNKSNLKRLFFLSCVGTTIAFNCLFVTMKCF